MEVNKKLHDLKMEYLKTPIPEQLEFLVNKSLKNRCKYIMRRKNLIKRASIAAASIAVCVVTLTVGINSSSAFASTLSRIPVVGGIVKVLTISEYNVNEDNFNANIKIPSIQGLENKALENSLNDKYLVENRKLYEEFIADVGDLKKSSGGHLGVDSGYVIKTDSEDILSVGRYVVNTVGSSSTTFKYDTIDKKKEVLITLPSLFKDDSYIEIISENIKAQMMDQMKSDTNKNYWVSVEGKEDPMGIFDKISANHNFYINAQNKLVISFDKYEVAPGSMGVVEFIIPTDAISDILDGNGYIK